jgi:hypothetical protein
LPDAARRAIELEFEVQRQQAKAQFPEVAVVGVDEAAYCKSDEFPRAYKFVLILNIAPHGDWCTVFNQEWRTSLYNMMRETSIYGNRVALIVADSDNLQNHVDWIRGVVERTNEWVRSRGFMNIDAQIGRDKARALEEFDAIQSMKRRTREIKI